MGKFDKLLEQKFSSPSGRLKMDLRPLGRFKRFAGALEKTTWEIGFFSKSKHNKKARTFAVGGAANRQPGLMDEYRESLFNSGEFEAAKEHLQNSIAIQMDDYIWNGQGSPFPAIKKITESSKPVFERAAQNQEVLRNIPFIKKQPDGNPPLWHSGKLIRSIRFRKKRKFRPKKKT